MKTPAFQFYPAEWLSSAKITLMTPNEEGAYIRLLCHCWGDPDCSIPDSDDELAVLSRLGEGWFKGGSTKLRKCFDPHPEIPGRLVNTRLLKERAKQANWRTKSAAGGVKSGKIRRGENQSGAEPPLKGGSLLVEPQGNSSASAYSSASAASSESRSQTPKSGVRSRRSQQCDEEYLRELQAKPAYADLNVDHCYGKMVTWCEVKGKQPTRSRLVNWLNREERPMTAASTNGGTHNADRRETASARNARLSLESIELLSQA